MKFKLAFIGYGTVGQGLTEILLEKKDMLAEKYDFHYKIVAISDIMKGTVYDEDGLDMEKILGAGQCPEDNILRNDVCGCFIQTV